MSKREKVIRRQSVPCYSYEHGIEPRHLSAPLRPRVVSLSPYDLGPQMPRVLQYDYDIGDDEEMDGSPIPSNKRLSKMPKRQSRKIQKVIEEEEEEEEPSQVVRFDRAVQKSVQPMTPLKGRSCTDVICLLLFVAFLVGWGFITTYAFKEGNLQQAIVPTDSKGSRCGIDPDVLNRSKVLFFDISECVFNPLTPLNGCQTPQVCVHECPNESFFIFLNQKLSDTELREKMICVDGFDKSQITKETAEKFTNGLNPACAKYYIQSTDIQNRCIPMLTFDFIDSVLKDVEEISKLDPSMKEHDLEKTFGKNNVGVMIFGDIQKSLGRILIGLVISMVACFIFIFLMRWLAGPVVWLSIFGSIGSLGFATYYSYFKYTDIKNRVGEKLPNDVKITFNLRAMLTQSLESEEIWFWILIISGVVLVLVLFITGFLRKRISIAIAIIKEGSKAVSSIKTAVFFPLLPLVFKIFIVFFGIFVALQLESIGDKGYKVAGLDENCTCIQEAVNYRNNESCSPKTFYLRCKTADGLRCPDATCHFMNFDIPDLMFYFKIYNVVGFFWVFFFITAFGEMVLGATFATWYWTFQKSEVPYFTVIAGMGRTVRYHLGTIAFGSLIITICQIMKMLLEYVNQQLKKHNNEFTRAIMCIFKCLFWCFEKFIKFLNKNAYIMCAIHGKNFCTSAKDAFSLILRNCVRAMAVDKVTDFLFFLSKILLSVGMGYLTYLYFSINEAHLQEAVPDARGVLSGFLANEVQYKEVPMILVGIGTYIIATLFFKVYSMAIDTLFLCFLEDCEINDGSIEKPYFMSKELMKILRKKNKENANNRK